MARTLLELRQIKLNWQVIDIDSRAELYRQFNKIAEMNGYDVDERNLVIAYADTMTDQQLADALKEFVNWTP